MSAHTLEIRNHPKLLTVQSHLTISDTKTNATLAVLVMGSGRAREVGALLASAPDLLGALGALGVIGNGYCFCSKERDPDKADHEPECAGARAAIAKARGVK